MGDPSNLYNPYFRITSVSSVEDLDDRDSVISLYGSRESLASRATPSSGRTKKPPLKLKHSTIYANNPKMHSLELPKHPVSPCVERKFDLKNTEKSTLASKLHHKSFSDLHKGLDSIFQPKSRPPSRASNFGDVPKELPKKETVQNSIETNNANDNKKSKILVKSLSRKNLLEEEQVKLDDCDVYHTITGGRIRALAATRSINPFSKITRRPLHKTLSQKTLPPKIESEEDVEEGSIMSIGEDPWRVRLSRRNERLWDNQSTALYCQVQFCTIA